MVGTSFSSQDFFQSGEYFHGVENFVIKMGIFTSSREYFCQVENYFFESNSVNLSRIFSWSQDFLPSANFFFNSRIPNMPCHLLPKWSNKMVACRFVGYIAFYTMLSFFRLLTVMWRHFCCLYEIVFAV